VVSWRYSNRFLKRGEVMDSDYLLFIHLKERYIQEIYEYLGEKDNRTATLEEIQQHLGECFDQTLEKLDPQLYIRRSFKPSEHAVRFLCVPTEFENFDTFAKDNLDILLWSCKDNHLNALSQKLGISERGIKIQVNLVLDLSAKLKAVMETTISDNVEIISEEEEWPDRFD